MFRTPSGLNSYERPILGYWSRSGGREFIPGLNQRMPAKASLTASISLHPKDGITPETVGKLRDWVGKQQNVSFALAVTEPNANGNGRHLHIAIGFKNPVKVSDDYKDRLKTALREELSDPTVWGRPSVVCKPHHDPAGLVGGYLKKDADYVKEWEHGTLPSEADQQAGAERRLQAIQAKKKKTVSKSQIPSLFKATHFQLIDELDEIEDTYSGLPDNEVDYRKLPPEQQVDYIYRWLIREGYDRIIMEMSPGKLKHFASIWPDLISFREV